MTIDDILCIKNSIEGKSESFKKMVQDKGLMLVFNYFISNFFYSHNGTWLKPFLDDILTNDENELLNMIIDLITNKSTSHYIDIVLDLYQNYSNYKTYSFVFQRLKKLFIIDGFDKIIDYVYERFHENSTYILENSFRNSKFFPLYKEVKVYIKKYLRQLYYLTYDLIKVCNNRTGTIDVLIKFVLDNSQNDETFLDDARDIVTNYTLAKLISDVIILDSPIGDKIFDELFLNTPLMNFSINFLSNRKNVEKLGYALIHLPNKTYIDTEFSQFIKDMYGEDKELLNFLINLTMTTIRNVITDKSIRSYVIDDIVNASEDLLLKNSIKTSNLSDNCLNLINYTFFSTLTE